MAKSIFGSPEVDAAVDRWLREAPLSLNDVRSYCIRRAVGEPTVIELVMDYQEPPRRAETTNTDQPVPEE